MDAWFDKLVKSLLEGEMKAGVLSVGLRGLDGVRRLVIVHHVIVVTGFLCALSLFATGFELCSAWAELRVAAPPAVLVYTVAVFVVSGGVLWYSCRSRTWVAAFGLKRQIKAALRDHHRAVAAAPTIDAEALAAQLEKIIDRKMAEGGRHGEV